MRDFLPTGTSFGVRLRQGGLVNKPLSRGEKQGRRGQGLRSSPRMDVASEEGARD